MNAYKTKAEMIEAYTEMLILDRVAHGQTFDRAMQDIGVLRMVAADRPVYAPHISNLGWFIRGFGFSTERNPGRPVFNLAAMSA